MFFSTFLLLAIGLSTIVAAQNSSSTTQSTYPYLLDPNDQSFTPDQRREACRIQRISCPLLCSTGAYPNTCDESTLTYTCRCNNGTNPDVTAYSQTLPYFECTHYLANCIAATDDAGVKQGCIDDIQCGVKGDPADYARAVSSSAAAAASTTLNTATTSMSSTPTSATSSPSITSAAPSTAAAVALGQTFGTGALVAGAFGAFHFFI